jgi:hypothetical protein
LVGTARAGPDQPRRPVAVSPDRKGVVTAWPERQEPVAMTLGLVASLGGGVAYGLLNEILPWGSYLLGRLALNMSMGVMQICGFVVGGVLVATLSPRHSAGRRGHVSGCGSSGPVRPEPSAPASRRSPVDSHHLEE